MPLTFTWPTKQLFELETLAPVIQHETFGKCVSFNILDMGTAEMDDSRQIVAPEQPAINTTRLLNKYLAETDVVLHIGDISYAEGYAATVSALL